MARYGANELFNPGGRRRKKTGQTGVVTGDQSGSLGSMPHSQAPDALALLTSALSLADEAFGKDDIKTDPKKENGLDPDNGNGNGNGDKKLSKKQINRKKQIWQY